MEIYLEEKKHRLKQNEIPVYQKKYHSERLHLWSTS